ncbi:MAG TPA: ABC transporter ATP-binding protein [Xanthobacteraceae bacterium]|jgi:putrescine transport system ATP-binding protein|nr:ABC transporter ATP-binding protein [Xanthobacteraceae bacterium]
MQTVESAGGSAKRGFAKRGFAPWADRNAQPLLRIEGLRKRFGAFAAVDQLSLDIYQGEFFALLGPSGCGKTTLLRLIAGFEEPDAGRILLDGVDLAQVPPHRRPVNMMFQSYALFPHLNVEANVAFGLKQEGLPKPQIAERVADMLALVRLESLGRRKPHELSGGQRQRVALARCLVKRPRLLLLDEPMAALDKKLRGETQFELMELQRRLGLTFIIVTHDQSEAMTVANRIAVMDRGRLMQIAPPAEIYEQPNSRWVADFIGEVNLFEGRVGDDGLSVEGTALGRLRVSAKVNAEPQATVWVAVRPEKMQIMRAEPAPDQQTGPENCAAATVVDVGYLGDLSIYKLRTEAGVPLKAAVANTGRSIGDAISWDDKVWLSFPPQAAIVLTR